LVGDGSLEAPERDDPADRTVLVLGKVVPAILVEPLLRQLVTPIGPRRYRDHECDNAMDAADSPAPHA
jgi:hypothetical protein